MRVSEMAGSLIGSEIIKLAGEINQKIAAGDHIYNFTIGDFDPAIFPIPVELNEEIRNAYLEGHTNYPAADGIADLRKEVQQFIYERQGLDYPIDSYLIAGGARPLIYAIYSTLLDGGDKVVFPTPSWNNNHYTHLCHGEKIQVETTPENNFMPVAVQLESQIRQARLISLCSPLNPTGTVFQADDLKKICNLILEENERRKGKERPVYLLYDQIYWMLTFANTTHFDPVTLVPEMRDYTIYVDGISKSFAATGVRVGWAFGPADIISKMKSILSHIGAWSPKAEQVATARYFRKKDAIDRYIGEFKRELFDRLKEIYNGIHKIKNQGHNIDAIVPQAGIYLTVKFDLIGKTAPDGSTLTNMKAVTTYLLEEAKLAIVPFYAFGSSGDSPWFRLSVGTCKKEEIPMMLGKLEKALAKLK